MSESKSMMIQIYPLRMVLFMNCWNINWGSSQPPIYKTRMSADEMKRMNVWMLPNASGRREQGEIRVEGRGNKENDKVWVQHVEYKTKNCDFLRAIKELDVFFVLSSSSSSLFSVKQSTLITRKLLRNSSQSSNRIAFSFSYGTIVLVLFRSIFSLGSSGFRAGNEDCGKPNKWLQMEMKYFVNFQNTEKI